jgi:hypothetical protein
MAAAPERARGGRPAAPDDAARVLARADAPAPEFAARLDPLPASTDGRRGALVALRACGRRARVGLPAAPHEVARVRNTDGRARAGVRSERGAVVFRRRAPTEAAARRGSTSLAAIAVAMAREVQGRALPGRGAQARPRRPSGGAARWRAGPQHAWTLRRRSSRRARLSEYRMPVAPVENPVLTVVPGFVMYPPELSYPTQPHTNGLPA